MTTKTETQAVRDWTLDSLVRKIEHLILDGWRVDTKAANYNGIYFNVNLVKTTEVVDETPPATPQLAGLSDVTPPTATVVAPTPPRAASKPSTVATKKAIPK